MCRCCCRTVTFLISSCFSFHPQFKCQNTTWIHNFPNICCADVWFMEKLKVPKLFHVILLPGNWWIWFLYLQNQIRLAASTMGADLEVFRIWNLSDQGPKEKETKERKEGRKKLVYNIITRNLLPMKLEKSARIEIYRKTICPAIRGALMGDWALNIP